MHIGPHDPKPRAARPTTAAAASTHSTAPSWGDPKGGALTDGYSGTVVSSATHSQATAQPSEKPSRSSLLALGLLVPALAGLGAGLGGAIAQYQIVHAPMVTSEVEYSAPKLKTEEIGQLRMGPDALQTETIEVENPIRDKSGLKMESRIERTSGQGVARVTWEEVPVLESSWREDSKEQAMNGGYFGGQPMMGGMFGGGYNFNPPMQIPNSVEPPLAKASSDMNRIPFNYVAPMGGPLGGLGIPSAIPGLGPPLTQESITRAWRENIETEVVGSYQKPTITHEHGVNIPGYIAAGAVAGAAAGLLNLGLSQASKGGGKKEESADPEVYQRSLSFVGDLSNHCNQLALAAGIQEPTLARGIEEAKILCDAGTAPFLQEARQLQQAGKFQEASELLSRPDSKRSIGSDNPAYAILNPQPEPQTWQERFEKKPQPELQLSFVEIVQAAAQRVDQAEVALGQIPSALPPRQDQGKLAP